MKTIILLLSTVLILVQAQNRNPELLGEDYKRSSDNSYFFVYETVDNQRRQESGGFEEINGVKSYTVRGSFSYIGPDGVFYEVLYKSDKDGFKPEGGHLPGSKIKVQFLPTASPKVEKLEPKLLTQLVGVKAQNQNPELVQEYDERNSDNSYYFVYETVDKQRREESGGFEEINGVKSYKVRGSYSFTGPDGLFYEIKYESGKDGFKPEGAHLPGAEIKIVPLIPETIVSKIDNSLRESLNG
uniref:CSON004585 protein n=1 Tax=Culicoides sonorensis TaxID=179676 RepID=A0A336LU00_CULSO